MDFFDELFLIDDWWRGFLVKLFGQIALLNLLIKLAGLNWLA